MPARHGQVIEALCASASAWLAAAAVTLTLASAVAAPALPAGAAPGTPPKPNEVTPAPTSSPADPPGYWSSPRGDYESRRRAFLEHAAAATPGGLYSQVARLAVGRAIDEGEVRKSIATLNERRDGGDFVANALLRLLAHEGPEVSPALRQEMEAALLGFKYWVDEPGGKDLLSMWSENHQINYHAAQYLAGERFTERTFTNAKQPGKWHADAGRRRVLRWIDIKAKTGFTEWDSNNCYINTMAALLNVAELAKDPEVARRAAMIVDVMFFDIAADSFRGSYGTAHGRTYPRAITAGGATEDTTGLARIAWGMGAIGKPDNVAAVYLATAQRYRVARTIEAAAQAMPEELVNKERQSLRIADGPRFGLSFDHPDGFFLLSGGGKFSTASYIERSFKVIDKVNVHRYGLVMRPYAEALLGTYRELGKTGKPVPDLDNQNLERVDKITYRTPDYQLSTVQDYRKGRPGAQQHIWQATLGPATQVFTINPGGSPKYWQGRLPRNGQHKNVLVSIYDVPAERPPGPKTIFPPDAKGDAVPSPAPSEEPLVPRTLAVFRRSAFDEVVQKGNWTFGRRGSGYVALYSQVPPTWSNEVLGGEGLIAEGRQNLFVTHLGREKVDGPFAAFVARVSEAKIAATPSSVVYAAPGLGEVRFAWDGPLRVAGKVIPITEYARFDNPFTRTPWGQGRYVISHAGHRLVMDFDKGIHEESGPEARTPRRGHRGSRSQRR